MTKEFQWSTTVIKSLEESYYALRAKKSIAPNGTLSQRLQNQKSILTTVQCLIDTGDFSQFDQIDRNSIDINSLVTIGYYGTYKQYVKFSDLISSITTKAKYSTKMLRLINAEAYCYKKNRFEVIFYRIECEDTIKYVVDELF